MVQQSQDFMGNITAIVMAVAAIAGVIGTFISHNDKLKKYGVYMTTFGQKTVEQEGNFAALGNAVLESNPEAKKYLEDRYGAQVAELRRRAEVAEAQLKKLSPTIPEKAQADNKDYIPR